MDIKSWILLIVFFKFIFYFECANLPKPKLLLNNTFTKKFKKEKFQEENFIKQVTSAKGSEKKLVS